MRADECCPPLGDTRGGREADVVHTIVAMLDLSRGDLLELGRAAQSRHYSSREHTIFYSYLQLWFSGLCSAWPSVHCVPCGLLRDHPDRETLTLCQTPPSHYSVTTEDTHKDLTLQSSNKRIKNILGARGNASLVTLNQCCHFLKP